MAGIQLKVSTEELRKKADEISGQAVNIENCWKQIYSLAEISGSYWEGDAGSRYRKYVKENDEDVKRLMKRLQEHPVDLQKMAGVYEGAEQEAAQKVSALPDDVII